MGGWHNDPLCHGKARQEGGAAFLTVFESLVIMISFGSLIIALITLALSMTQKKHHFQK